MTDIQINQEISATIFKQLGGNKFKVMTGSHNFAFDGPSLQMHLRRNKSKAKYLKITLIANDTYQMVFSKLTKKAGKTNLIIVRELNNIYADQLQNIFTDITGLYTHF